MKVKKSKRSVAPLTPFWIPLTAGILIFSIAFGLLTMRDRQYLQSVLHDTLTFMKNRIESYDHYRSTDKTKSLMRLADKVEALNTELKLMESYDVQSLDSFARQQRLTGVLLLDEHLNVTMQTTLDEQANGLWTDVIQGPGVRNIVTYPKKRYLARIDMEGESYDFVAMARTDAPGMIVAFMRQDIIESGNVELSMATLFTDFTFELNGIVTVTDGKTVLSSNAPQQIGMTNMEALALASRACRTDSDGLERFQTDGVTWYGGKCVSGEYCLYAFFPSSAVFQTRMLVMTSGIAMYAFVWMIFVLLRSRLEWRNLKQRQDQMHTIQSISSVYSATLLIHVKTDKVEVIKAPQILADNVRDMKTASALIKYIQETYVCEKGREAYQAFTDVSSLPRRLQMHAYLTHTCEDIYGEWYLNMIIPQQWDRHRQIDAVILTMQNVTEEKRRENSYQEQLRRAADQAERANAAKTGFLRRMSHDIRTPINVIRGMANIGQHSLDKPEKVEECLNKIMLASGFLLDLVNNVLDMNKLESGAVKLENRPFDLRAVLKEVVNIVESGALERGLHFSEEPLKATHVHLIGSPLHVRQVLQNVAGNAVKYNKDNGSIVLACQEIAYEDNVATFEFVCADTGIGMSQEFQQHAFEPFAQEDANARTSYAGTGLGLAIVKELVERMGGSISFTSRLGEGTTFRIQLSFRVDPSAQEDEAPTEAQTVQEHNRLKGIRLLLVEDNELNMEIAQFLLEGEGVTVTKAWNGQAAVEKFASMAPGSCDVILMDVMMPVLNGLDATKAIRAMDRPDAKTIPIFAMTANAFADDEERSREVGMNEHITKPLNIDQIVATIKKYCK